MRQTRTDRAALLAEELERLKRELAGMGAKKIVLFGSYARGRADALTDLDLMVVMESDLPFVERLGMLYRRLAPRVAVDILAYTPEEWRKMQETPFVRRALKEGRVLYEADAE
ncbi:MAG: nucleotidyltransferase domain-containing protein [Bacillota bacterium]